MQRYFLWLSAIVTLYVSSFAYASAATQINDKSAEKATDKSAVKPAEKTIPHIALLLPLKSASFGYAAEALQQGFQAAASKDLQQPGNLPVRIYGLNDEAAEVVALYRTAIAEGARAVVGPMTRTGVSALVAGAAISVPTLALNQLEHVPPAHFYTLGMAAEAEARQVAQLAKQQGMTQAIVMSTNLQLSKRLQHAFEEEWISLGGTIKDEINFDNDLAVLSKATNAPGTVLFLAAEAEKVRVMRAYLPKKMSIYATSLVFSGNGDALTNFDMDGIRFVDMPWLLQPDHPAVMIYPRHTPVLPANLERFYALGIDAYRLVQLLLSGKVESSLPLDGVSGKIELKGNNFKRTALPAIMEQGQGHLQNSPEGRGGQPENTPGKL